MPQEIRIIDAGGVNCYLVKTGDGGYLLIDTGVANKRTKFEKELQSSGCKPGNLKLIVLTHGDPDHTGNCAYLREKYGAKIALHPGDSGMVERGDLVWNIGKPGFHYIDDLAAANASIEKLKRMQVKTVYPGHGQPFQMERLANGYRPLCH